MRLKQGRLVRVPASAFFLSDTSSVCTVGPAGHFDQLKIPTGRSENVVGWPGPPIRCGLGSAARYGSLFHRVPTVAGLCPKAAAVMVARAGGSPQLYTADRNTASDAAACRLRTTAGGFVCSKANRMGEPTSNRTLNPLKGGFACLVRLGCVHHYGGPLSTKIAVTKSECSLSR